MPKRISTTHTKEEVVAAQVLVDASLRFASALEAGCVARAQARTPPSELRPSERWGVNVPLDQPPALMSALDAAK